MHPVFGIAQNLQDFCFFRALWRGVHVLPPAGRGEIHSDCPTGCHLSCTRQCLDLSCLFWGCKAAYTVDTLRSGDSYGYKSLSSVKTNNTTRTDRRNVSLIFFPTSGKAGRTKKKQRVMAPTPQCMQVYLQRSCSSLLWQTSITRKTSKKGTQTILTVRTRDLVFPEAGLEALQRPCWILVLQTKVMRDHFLLKRQLKEAWQRKCQQSQRDGYLFPFFFPQEGPIHAVKQAIYIDENKQNQIIPAMKSKDRTVLHHQLRNTSSAGSRMKPYGENRTAFTVKG